MTPSIAMTLTRDIARTLRLVCIGLTLLPGEEGTEQVGTLGICDRRPSCLCGLRQECIETLFRRRVRRIARGDNGRCLSAVNPGLRSVRPMPAFQRRREIHFAPFWMAGLGKERVELAEEGIDEPR